MGAWLDWQSSLLPFWCSCWCWLPGLIGIVHCFVFAVTAAWLDWHSSLLFFCVTFGHGHLARVAWFTATFFGVAFGCGLLP